MRSVSALRRCALLIGLGLLLPAAAAAQVSAGKLTGVVTDQQSGDPLTGVQVFIEGTGRGSLTGENGRYFVINVPPGTYTVVAQLIGYAEVRKQNVQISIDVTRTLDFVLPSQAVAVEGVVVQAERVPLVQTNATGSAVTTTAAELAALPVVDISGALSLEQGFLAVPENTTIRSYLERRQNPLSPISIRGGRGGETLTLIDGIPVNNFVFGGQALDITTKAVDQIDFIKGGFEPQYGNALSGIINIVTTEGGTDYRGALEYQTSSIAGAMGSTPDELKDFDLFEGQLSGPVPGTNEKLRFVMAGRQLHGRDRVLEFDDDIFRPSVRADGLNTPSALDLIPGWRPFGFEQQRDILGKLTYYFTPAAKLNLTVLDYTLEHQDFDFDFILTGFDPLSTPAAVTAADSQYLGLFNRYRDVVYGTNFLDRRLWVVKYNQTLNRTAFSVATGLLDQSRTRCNFFQGFCLQDHFADLNFNGRFVAPGTESFNPTEGTDNFYGGERLRTAVARVDLQSQVTDHHNLQAGLYYEAHDLDYLEFEAIESDQPFKVQQRFAARPTNSIFSSDNRLGIPIRSDLWNGAAYVQDKIEYDFITVALGFRFDIGRAGGIFFGNPLDPTNGTTAVHVCGDAGRFGADPSYFTGLEACADQAVRDSASIIAHRDDFEESAVRTQFSPRIGVSFPVTESSNIFFNFGRYSQNPLLTNLFRNTGIGTAGEGVPCGTQFLERNPLPDGSARPANAAEVGQCGPVLFSPRLGTQFLGNPNLLTEATTSYELGYLAEVGNNYAVTVIAFNKDQYGLTGVRQGRINDPGATYGTSGARYSILVNQDYQTVRGFEVSLRRRLADYWAMNLNYSYSQARTNAAPPQREFEAQEEEGDQTLRREVTAEIDRPHVFNATFRVEVAEDTPDIPLGQWLRNANAAITMRASSGFPYTPVPRFNPAASARAERYSGRMPAHWVADLRASKQFDWDGLKYGVFLRVQNLFDTKYCVQVFESTGRCDQGTIDQARARIGNPVSEQTTSTYFDRPHFFGPRRSISAGLRMDF